MRIQINSPGHLALRQGLTWEAIPSFAVLTGSNGSGKSQLLQLIDNNFSWQSFTKKPNTPISITEVSLEHGDVAFSASEFQLTSTVANGGVLFTKFQEAVGLLRSPTNATRNDQESFYKHRRYEHLRAEIEPIIGRKIEDMSEEELRSNLPFTFSLSTKYAPQSISGELSLIFFSYHMRLRDRRLDHGETEEQAKAALGTPPWDTFDMLLSSFGLPFECSKPAGNSMNRYVLTLIDVSRGISISLANLSSGEKALVGMIVWMLTFGFGALPKLILLDEPDAHLHASLIPRFVDALHSTIVGKFGSKIIMTTHRAETVLRCPEGSLFELRRDALNVSAVADRAVTTAALTSAAFVVLAGVRCVLVEDQDDAEFFSMVCRILWADGRLPFSPRLIFQPVSVRTENDAKGGGRTVVKGWVKKMADSGLSQVVQGLVDHDNKPESTEGIFQISRYAIGIRSRPTQRERA